MPYIDGKVRERLEFHTHSAVTAGELNYQITQLVLDYIERKGMSYTVCNEAIGAMECAKLELYRRKLAPYEDKKIVENGDLEGYRGGKAEQA
jgi:hypothetical protein